MNDDLLDHIDRLIQQRPVCKDVLTSYRELVNIMNQVEPRAQEMVLDDNLKEVKAEQGFPLFSREDLPLDFSASSDLLIMLLKHLADSEREDSDGIKKALEAAKNHRDWTNVLLKALLEKNSETLSKIGEDVGLEPGTLDFLARVALRPSLHVLRQSLSSVIDGEHWDHEYCPLCGSHPNMAYFAKPGKRYLHCELCGEEWSYSRLKCAFCRNDDQKTLGYFQAEGEEGFRVDFCRKCLRYIKTLDRRVFEEAVPLELENLATIHLDMLAVEHGFK